MRVLRYDDGRNEIYVDGKVEYVYGEFRIKKLNNGLTRIVAGDDKGAVAVWKGGGYVVWVWDGKCWTKYVDLRYKFGDEWMKYLSEIKMVKNNEVSGLWFDEHSV